VIEAVIAERLGLASRPSWPREIPRALEKIGGERGLPVADLLLRMDREPQLLAELAGHLMVGETYFLRHADHFDFLVEFLVARQREMPGRRLKVWSAGCSSGEEPYSLALVLREAMGTDWWRQVEILASDIDAAAIQRARDGRYGPWSFRGTPPGFAQANFRADRDREGLLCLPAEVTRQPRFACAPIETTLDELGAASLDAVLFRNVGIYLVPESCQRIYRGFSRVLAPGGVLCVAPADPRPAAELFAKASGDEQPIYARTDLAKECASPARQERARRVSALGLARRSARLRPAVRHLEPGARPESPDESALTRAVRCGDRGDSRGALELLGGLLAGNPRDASAYLRRGLIHLSQGDAERAVADLRSAVFLDGADPIARFWLAWGCRAAGETRRALAELETLSDRLGGLGNEAVLGDGETRAEDLREAVRRMQEEMT